MTSPAAATAPTTLRATTPSGWIRRPRGPAGSTGSPVEASGILGCSQSSALGLGTSFWKFWKS